ncbi:MAG: glycosyl transferase family protein [Rhodocyclaceae bacterium]|nr:MAG: glycosyl transferase family protein [Rhodocyclaceae bacterium]TND04923.1 MAG: glycosyl transferase family protein [Rhodocyclaceae bacterium]
MTNRKLISIVTPCYNEEGNVEELHRRIAAQVEQFPDYDFEHIYIDNASTDGTVAAIRRLASADSRVRAIVNNRNFGIVRSSNHGLLQARGDAVINMASDMQEPPELIGEFIRKWEQGHKVVAGVKPESHETAPMFALRRLYYATIGRIAEIKLIPHYTGFGLYDREVIEGLRRIDDPYPYFRGLIADMGFAHAEVPYVQPLRKRGITKSNFYALYDMAMLGITSHSKVPLRLATMAGFALSAISLLIALGYLILKLTHWNQMSFGLAPILIGFFFFASVQLFFIGLLGEYILQIHTQVQKRPLVMERERINFD